MASWCCCCCGLDDRRWCLRPLSRTLLSCLPRGGQSGASVYLTLGLRSLAYHCCRCRSSAPQQSVFALALPSAVAAVAFVKVDGTTTTAGLWLRIGGSAASAPRSEKRRRQRRQAASPLSTAHFAQEAQTTGFPNKPHHSVSIASTCKYTASRKRILAAWTYRLAALPKSG